MHGPMDVKYIFPLHTTKLASLFSYITLKFKECNNYTLNNLAAVTARPLYKPIPHFVSPKVLASSPLDLVPTNF